jgi:tRNA(Ile2) C34 agmatinyltransferase TiaS
MTTETIGPRWADFRCPRCGRRVKRPGFGPVCAAKVKAEFRVSDGKEESKDAASG